MDLESVKIRLAILGYTATDEDDIGILYAIQDTKQHILNQCNLEEIPEELETFAIDGACSRFLNVKRVTGALDESFNIEQGASEIRVGDTTVSLTGQSRESLLDTMINGLNDNLEREMLCFRKIRW